MQGKISRQGFQADQVWTKGASVMIQANAALLDQKENFRIKSQLAQANTTTLACASATGNVLPPPLYFQREKHAINLFV